MDQETIRNLIEMLKDTDVTDMQIEQDSFKLRIRRERTVGGSSGGEGAIIGAGGSPFGLGSGRNALCPRACGVAPGYGCAVPLALRMDQSRRDVTAMAWRIELRGTTSPSGGVVSLSRST